MVNVYVPVESIALTRNVKEATRFFKQCYIMNRSPTDFIKCKIQNIWIQKLTGNSLEERVIENYQWYDIHF